jgi:hypothetical protein
MKRLLALLLLLAAPALGQITLSGSMSLSDVTIQAEGGVQTCNDVSGLVLWLDAEQGVTDAGDFTWVDQSSTGLTCSQTTDANEPDLITNCQNGNDCVEFDGATSPNEDVLTCDGTLLDPSTTSFTIFVVYDYDIGTGSRQAVISQADATNMGHFFFGASGARYTNLISAGNADSDSLNTPLTNTIYIHQMTYDNSTTDLVDWWVNGSAGDQNDAHAALSSTGNLQVGAMYNDQATYKHDGKLYEVCVYNSVLSTADREAVRDALNSKWGVY